MPRDLLPWMAWPPRPFRPPAMGTWAKAATASRELSVRRASARALAPDARLESTDAAREQCERATDGATLDASGARALSVLLLLLQLLRQQEDGGRRGGRKGGRRRLRRRAEDARARGARGALQRSARQRRAARAPRGVLCARGARARALVDASLSVPRPYPGMVSPSSTWRAQCLLFLAPRSRATLSWPSRPTAIA